MGNKIGVLGSGIVGRTLAHGLRDLNYEVAIGSRTGHNVDDWDGQVGTFKDVAEQADLIILAVKGSAAGSIVASIRDSLAGKTVIDTTNPLSNQPAEEGVVRYFTSLDESLMERLQLLAQAANFVKAFNSVGNAIMVNPIYAEGKASMFICGNDEKAKQEVTLILNQLGWEVEDMGGVKSARAIEPLCILWCIPGILRNQWSHAFKLLKR